jgi:hypothetical protein
MKMRRLYFWITMAMLALSVGLSQETVGSIIGRVTDTSGSVVGGAEIRVVNTGTGVESKTTSNDVGNYLVSSLPPGTYRLSADHAGFKRVEIPAIVLEIQQQARADIRLDVGEVHETVSVTAPPPQLITDDATLGEVIDNKTVVEIPILDRNMAELALLSAGVVNGTNNSTNTTVADAFTGGIAISANGMRPSSNQFSIDGGNANIGLYNYPSLLPMPDAVGEFKVRTGAYSAEYGGFGGAHIDYSLKSGTNQFHGGLWEFLSNDALNARNAFAVGPKPVFRQNQFGGILSGPVVHNKTFFMYSYQGLRRSDQRVGQGNVPTEAQRSGDLRFAAGGGAIRPFNDPLSGRPFPNNLIPASRISPTMAEVLKFYPMPNQIGTPNYVSYEGVPNNNNMVLTKVDHYFGQDRVSAHYAIQNIGFVQTPALIRDFGLFSSTRAQNAAISGTHIFSPATIADMRLSWDRHFLYNTTPRNTKDNSYDARSALHMVIPSSAGPGNIENGVPYIQSASFAVVGDVTNGSPLIQPDEVYQFAAGLTSVRSRHNLKFGTDLRHTRSARFRTQNTAGALTFAANNPAGTGYDVADILLGLPSSTRITTNPITVDMRQWRTDFYALDNWTVTPKLTLNLGLRYEFNFPLTETGGRMPLFSFNPPGGFSVAKPGQAMFDPDYNDFAPRFGLAYRALPGTVVRAGYGIFYSGPKLLGMDNLAINPPLVTLYTFTASAAAPLSASNPFPIESYTAGGVASPYVLQRNVPTPYVQTWSFNVQQRLPKNIVLEVGYVGNLALHMLRTVQLNVPAPGPGAIQPRRPLPDWGQVTYIQGDAISNYHGLLTRFERRFAGGLSIHGTYTFARAIDLSGDEQLGGTIDPSNLNRDRSLSDFFQKQRLSLSYVFELPFGPGKPLLNSGGPVGQVVRGWQVSGVSTFMSGVPLTVGTNATPANIGLTGASNRPNRLCDGNLDGGGTTRQWFDTSCFVLPPQFTIGNSGRNIIIGPGSANWNVGMSRRFRLYERHALFFRAEMFNAVNHVNLGNPQAVVGAANIGQILRSGPARRVQMALKYNF